MYILYINNLIVTSDNLIVDIKNRFYEHQTVHADIFLSLFYNSTLHTHHLSFKSHSLKLWWLWCLLPKKIWHFVSTDKVKNK